MKPCLGSTQPHPQKSRESCVCVWGGGGGGDKRGGEGRGAKGKENRVSEDDSAM